MHTWLQSSIADTDKQTKTLCCSSQTVMAILYHFLLISSLVPLVLNYPFIPPTCYSKVLNMARDLTHWAAYLKRAPETTYCMAHMPDLHLDIHNGCVMYKMRTYISLVDGLRERRCAYTRDVWRLGSNLRQLFIFMSEKCHGVRDSERRCLYRCASQSKLYHEENSGS
ncbi:cytokine-like protein 1 [Cynoglossus semilaevis]|uniref:cytokine-like protein 1 n=1 Tax=Cynoglossus semilaevis TaxID=244447 RepID=UPI000D6232AE|nr:cytokine-like protein 1 [Cynoglossus semilaevis]